MTCRGLRCPYKSVFLGYCAEYWLMVTIASLGAGCMLLYVLAGVLKP